jgi:hypothetical protein
MGIDFDNRHHRMATYHEYTTKRLKNLHRLGFEVVNKKSHKRPKYELPYFFNEKSSSETSYDYYHYDYEETTIWELRADDQVVDELINLADRIESHEHHIQSISYEASATQRELDVHQKKIANLKKTLRENPGLQEQWDELMVMMKLAGFDETLA